MKTVLVTGAAKRIGRAVAWHLAKQGMQVAVHCHRSIKEAESLVAQIHQTGAAAFVVQGDLADESTCREMIETVRLAGPEFHSLIHCASTFTEDSVLDFSFPDLLDHVKINAFAPLVLSREFARHVDRGTIISFLDSRVVDYDRIHASYHLSKRLFDSITRMLAVELAPHIRVNAVAPGLILPPEGEGAAYVEKRKAEIPLQRQGNLDEICMAVDFLLNNEFVTGQTIFVDGGRHLTGAFYG